MKPEHLWMIVLLAVGALVSGCGFSQPPPFDHKEHCDEEAVHKEMSSLPFDCFEYICLLFWHVNILLFLWFFSGIIE